MKRRLDRWQIAVFLIFILGLTLLNVLTPIRDFSPMENRNLATAPVLSAQALFSGQFSKDFETYITDQFVWRDGWIALKAWSERLSGKKENNGVYICGDTLIERFDLSDGGERFHSNLTTVDRFAARVDVPVYLALIPTAAEIWRDKLPKGAPTQDQTALLDSITTQAQYVDVLSALQAHSSEPIYYRTDHHWTSLGACYGAQALLNAMDKAAASPEQFAPEVVSDHFFGTLYSSSGARYVPPDSIERYVSDEGVRVTSYEGGKSREGSLYDESKLAVKDQYAYFLGGNQPLAVIDTGAQAEEKLLLVRDSYADSLAPFLLNSFSEIHMVDLRYYRLDIAQYVEEHDIDRVVILYSLKNFSEDQNVYFLCPRQSP